MSREQEDDRRPRRQEQDLTFSEYTYEDDISEEMMVQNEDDIYSQKLEKAHDAYNDMLEAEFEMGTYFLSNISAQDMKDFLVHLQ